MNKMNIKKRCINCSKDIYKFNNRFCNRKCVSLYRRRTYGGINNPLYTRIKVNCTYCNKEIIKKPSELKHKPHCSKKCVYLNKDNYLRGKNHPSYKKKIELLCSYCNKMFIRYPSQIKKNNYCCRECEYKNYRISLRGINNPFYGKKLSQEHKELLMQKHIEARKDGKFNIRPSKPEQQLIQLFQQYNLSFKYTGDGKFWIGYYNPDFIDKENMKIIEYDSKYWHTLPYSIEKDKRRNLTYLDAGWDIMCINEDNLNDDNKLIADIQQFLSHENKER